MAVQIKTLTAPQQHISPENDAIFRDLVISDGWLNGRAGLSISGSSFVVTACYLTIGGRLVNVNQSTISVPIEGSGSYAYLILTIDTSNSASPVTQLEVVTSNSRAFPSVRQDRINTYGSGTVYQTVLAAARYSSGSWSLIFVKRESHSVGTTTTFGIRAVDGWTAVGDEQELVLDLASAEPGMNIIVSPDPADRDRYIAAGLYLYGIGVGQLIWRRKNSYGTAINVNLLFL